MAVTIPGRGWGADVKLYVAQKWLETGQIRKISDETGVAYETILDWKKQPWWAELLAELKSGRNARVNGKMTNIIDESLEIIQDRLHNGDVVLNQKTGELVRKPVPLKEVNAVVTNMMTRQSVLEKLEHDGINVEATKSINDQLKLLAKEFARFNGRSKDSAEVIEYKEVSDAIEREVGETDPGAESQEHRENSGMAEEEPRGMEP